MRKNAQRLPGNAVAAGRQRRQQPGGNLLLYLTYRPA